MGMFGSIFLRAVSGRSALSPRRRPAALPGRHAGVHLLRARAASAAGSAGHGLGLQAIGLGWLAAGHPTVPYLPDAGPGPVLAPSPTSCSVRRDRKASLGANNAQNGGVSGAGWARCLRPWRSPAGGVRRGARGLGRRGGGGRRRGRRAVPAGCCAGRQHRKRASRNGACQPETGAPGRRTGRGTRSGSLTGPGAAPSRTRSRIPASPRGSEALPCALRASPTPAPW